MNSYIYVDGWKSNIRFSSAHVISEYEKCGRLHGHTYAVHVKITGDADDKGIILDFSVLKDVLREIVSKLDHKVLIPEKSKVLNIKNGENVELSSPGKKYVLPAGDCVFLPIESTSAENLSKYLLEELIEKLPNSKNLKSIEVGVDEGYGQGARIIKNLR